MDQATKPRARRGRPTTGIMPMYAVRLPPVLRKALDKWATAHGLKQSEAIRFLLAQALRG